MGLVPLLLGLLFELVVVAPLRVSLDQTPVFFPWQVSLFLTPVRSNPFSDLERGDGAYENIVKQGKMLVTSKEIPVLESCFICCLQIHNLPYIRPFSPVSKHED